MKVQSLVAVTAALAISVGVPRAVQPQATGPRSPRTDLNSLRRAAMNNGGKAERGKTIYQSAKAQCTPCHKVHGQGGEVGPDLSRIGGTVERTRLVLSTL